MHWTGLPTSCSGGLCAAKRTYVFIAVLIVAGAVIEH